MQSQFSKIVLAVVITAVIVGAGVYYWQEQRLGRAGTTYGSLKSPQQTPGNDGGQSPLVTITSPANGSSVANARITGKTRPNYLIWGYINMPVGERIGASTYANGGADRADANGNFALDLAEPCSRNLNVVVVAVDEADSRQEYWSADNVSKPVAFTFTGELPGVCTQ